MSNVMDDDRYIPHWYMDDQPDDEIYYHTYINPEIWVHDIRGACMGSRLNRRNVSDNHLVFSHMVEDDGYWIPDPSNSGSSSFWLLDMKNVIDRTMEWLEKNAVKGQWGWELKEGYEIQHGY